MTIGVDASRANVRERTGTEAYSFAVIRRLVALRRDIQFRLYVSREPLPELRELGPNVELCVLRWPPRFLWSLLRFSWEMLWHAPDALFVPAHTIPLIHPRATVTTLHDVGFERFPELYSTKPIGPGGRVTDLLLTVFTLGRFRNSELDYHRFSMRWAIARASRLITISEFSRREIEHFFPTSRGRLTVIPLGIESQEISVERIPAILEGVLPRSVERFFLYYGRLEQKKNIDGLVRAYAAYWKSQPTAAADLVLIGNHGLGFEGVRRFIDDERLTSHIHILGWQPRLVIDALLQRSLALTFLSRYEGFGLPVLEAMAVGVPVIASTAGSIPEVAGGAALLVDADDTAAAAAAMSRVAHDVSLRENLARFGRERAASFSWDHCAERTLEVILNAEQGVAT